MAAARVRAARALGCVRRPRIGARARRICRQTAAPDELARARDLFTVAIETPGGLKVQTIHAFCERLLQRFPWKPASPPQFAILDDETTRALQREAIEDVLIEATRDPAAPLGRALAQSSRSPPTTVSTSCCAMRSGSATGWRRPTASISARMTRWRRRKHSIAGRSACRRTRRWPNSIRSLVTSLPEATLRRGGRCAAGRPNGDIALAASTSAAAAAASGRSSRGARRWPKCS